MHTQKGAKHAQIKESTGFGQVLGREKAQVHDLFSKPPGITDYPIGDS